MAAYSAPSASRWMTVVHRTRTAHSSTDTSTAHSHTKDLMAAGKYRSESIPQSIPTLDLGPPDTVGGYWAHSLDLRRRCKGTLKNGHPARFQHAKRKRGFRFTPFSATDVAENGGVSCPAREALINQRFLNG